MTQELHIRTIEVPDDIDINTMYGLISLTNHLPKESDLNGGTHDDIRSTLEGFVGNESNPAALLIAEQLPLGRAVGYVATQIDTESPDVAEITQLVVAPSTDQAREVGTLLIQEAELWGSEHDVRVVIPRTIEFAGRVVGKEVVSIGESSGRSSSHPSNFLG